MLKILAIVTLAMRGAQYTRLETLTVLFETG